MYLISKSSFLLTRMDGALSLEMFLGRTLFLVSNAMNVGEVPWQDSRDSETEQARNYAKLWKTGLLKEEQLCMERNYVLGETINKILFVITDPL